MNCDTNQNDQASGDGEFNEYNKREEDQRKLEMYNMTTFQMKWCQEKAQEDDFDFWVHTRGSKKRGQGTLVMPWYTKDGRFHAVRLGMTEVIGEAHSSATGKVEGVALDVTFTPKQPGKTWNDKQVRFAMFLEKFCNSHSYDATTGIVTCYASDKEAAVKYLQTYDFKFAGYAADKSEG
jgi:hypothetical protein